MHVAIIYLKAFKSYFIGFVLSMILTIIPFYLVITDHKIFKKSTLFLIVISCAIIQIYIHLIFFLHINDASNKIWNLISLIFTTFITLILILGSIWIMTHLHHNLMTS